MHIYISLKEIPYVFIYFSLQAIIQKGCLGEDCEKTTWNELHIYTKKEWTYKR